MKHLKMNCIYVLQWGVGQDKEQYAAESMNELLSTLRKFLVDDLANKTTCDYIIKVRELPDDVV